MNSELIKNQIEQLHLMCCLKFPILVLIDLGGTVFYRSSEKNVRGSKFDAKIQKYMYFFRPGHKNLLKTLFNHPRITLGFYTSIMQKNIVPVMEQLLKGELQEIAQSLMIFD